MFESAKPVDPRYHVDWLLDRAKQKGLAVQVILRFPKIREELPLPPPLEPRDEEPPPGRKKPSPKPKPPPVKPPAEKAEATSAKEKPSRSGRAPLETVNRGNQRVILREDINLTEREKNILAMRFGSNSGTPHTLEAVGKAFGLTRERIRQIQAKALKARRRDIEP